MLDFGSGEKHTGAILKPVYIKKNKEIDGTTYGADKPACPVDRYCSVFIQHIPWFMTDLFPWITVLADA